METEDTQDTPITINITQPLDFPVVTCNSPDSGVEFHKEQSNSVKSSVSSEQSEGTSSAVLCPASVGGAFLLSLRLSNPQNEFLVHKLQTDVTCLVSNTSMSPQDSTEAKPDNSTSTTQVVLQSPEVAYTSQPLCCICRKSKAEIPAESSHAALATEYRIQVTSEAIPVSVNGQKLLGSALLHHGDLLAIGKSYLFMFQDYSCITNDHIPEYHWQPHPLESTWASTTPEKAHRSQTPGSLTDDEAVVEDGIIALRPLQIRQVPTVVVDEEILIPISNPTARLPEKAPPTYVRQLSSPQTVDSEAPREPINQIIISEDSSAEHPFEVSDVFDPEHFATSTPEKPPTSPPFKDRRSSGGRTSSSSSSSLPRKRRLMFSYSVGEEDELLKLVVTNLDPLATKCKLAPAYVLAMCVEFSLKCNGPTAAARFVQKAVDSIQEVVWECTRKVTDWQPDPAQVQQPLSLLGELFSLLQPVFFWLSNMLELHHFLSQTAPELDFASLVPRGEEGEGECVEEDSVTVLQHTLMYTFQQAFYPVSKVLYHSLPLMLESCAEERMNPGRGRGVGQTIVIDQAVDFLQALLDLLTELQLHLGVVSQFYANVFFFINATMFNALVDQGLGLFQHTSGTALRANLNLLEGWACQVGFKEAVLHYLAKFSSAIDLLASPGEELLLMDWQQLCVEFPVLHSAQLHFILSNYLLPHYQQQVPKHWTPSRKEAITALNREAIRESFEAHPGFTLPSSGYTMDLSQPPPDQEHFQTFMETLSKHLKKPRRSVDIVPVVESCPSASIPALITEPPQTPPTGRRKDSRTEHNNNEVVSREHLIESCVDSPQHSRGIGSNTESQEDLLEEVRNRRNLQEGTDYQDMLTEKAVQILQVFGSEEKANEIALLGGKGTEPKERVERVRSLLAPRSCATPEKLILNGEEEVDPVYAEWMSTHFPSGSTTVTVPRGEKGFGIIMVEGKDPKDDDCAIYIRKVLAGSTADQSNQLMAGDQILAIDGQILDGADYIIAQKYLKEAEDDVSLVIAPRTRPIAINQPFQTES